MDFQGLAVEFDRYGRSDQPGVRPGGQSTGFLVDYRSVRPVAATVATVWSRFYRDSPLFHVMPACLHRDEPATPDQSFGRFERTLPIPDGVRPEALNISRADDGLFPVILKPAE